MSSTEEAKKTAQAFLDAFNRVDVAGIANACNFPHVRLANGVFTTHKTREDFIQSRANLKAQLKAEGWAYTHTESIDVIHAGPDKVHLAIINKRQHADGTVYKPFNTLWIVTLQNGRWGVQFRSSYLT